MKKSHDVSSTQKGFTLVEILIVLAIITILTTIVIPAIIKIQTNARIAKVANELRVFSQAFQSYSFQNGTYPADTHITLPPVMVGYINQKNWDADALGGNYNWEGPLWGAGGSYPYAGISLQNTTATTVMLTQLDDTLDNGDLTTGSFRQTPNGRYTYIFEE